MLKYDDDDSEASESHVCSTSNRVNRSLVQFDSDDDDDDDVDFSYSTMKQHGCIVDENEAALFEIVPYNNNMHNNQLVNDNNDNNDDDDDDDSNVFVSQDSERQILLIMLLAQVCALHDATPRTFTVHVLSLFERGILDHHSIRFLFDLDLVPQDALADFNRFSAVTKTNKDRGGANKQQEEYTGAIIPYNTTTAATSPRNNTSSLDDTTRSTNPSPLLQTALSINTNIINNTAHTQQQQHQHHESESSSVLLQQQEYMLERKVREASVSAIRKILERHDSNESSSRASLLLRHQQSMHSTYSVSSTSTSIGSTSINHFSHHDDYPVIKSKVECSTTNNHVVLQKEMQHWNTDNTTIKKNGQTSATSTASSNNTDPHSSSVASVLAATTNMSSSSSWSVEHHPLSLSRYQREFIQIRKLAAGSFGEVYHVLRKLDHREYAMKRVMFTATGFSNESVHLVLREVRCLAQCDHPNCVRYYTSWLEPSWMTGSGLSTPDQIGVVNKATQRKVLTDIHQLVLATTTPKADKQQEEQKKWEHDDDDEAMVVNKHLHHIDELLFGGRHHRHLLVNHEAEQKQKNRLLSPSSREEEPVCTNSEWSDDDDDDDDITIGRNEYYYNGDDSSIGFTFQESTANNGGGANATSRREKRRNNEKKAKQPNESVPATTNASRYNYHICLFIQMQLCHSRTLSDWIRQRNCKQDDVNIGIHHHQWALDVYQIFRQVVCGLAHVHGKGILHRDLKPANIFAADDGVFKIGDFGLSKLLGVVPQQHSSSSSSHANIRASPTTAWRETTTTTTTTGHTSNTVGVGTLTYASPEQITSNEYCSKADIFSLGLILLELCCNFGTEHERAQSFHNVRISRSVPRKVERWFPRAASLILACTEPDPNNRPSANDILSDDMFQESNTEILRLRVELRTKDVELERCQAMLHEKDCLIDDLRRRLLALQSSNYTETDIEPS